MSQKNVGLSVAVSVLCFALAAVPAFGGSSIVGSVAGSTNATIGGQPAVNGSAIFSGESLQVTDGVAFVTLGQGSRAVFGRNSVASFSREGASVTARLLSGSVSIFQRADEQNGVRVKFDDMTIGPAGGYKTLGEVALLANAVVVRTKVGVMSVNFASGKITQVPAGKVLTLTPAQRAPQGTAGSQHSGSGFSGVEWAALAAAGTAAVLAGVDISKTDNATSAANSAAAAANAAGSAATAAGSAASVAAAEANSAAIAAALAESISCELEDAFRVYVSPYAPPTGLPACCAGTACPG